MTKAVGWISLVCGIVFACLPIGAFAAISCPPKDSQEAKGYIYLNTNIPFVGQCIKKTADPDPNDSTAWNSFGLLLGGMMKIAMTVVLIIAFLAVLVAWVMMAAGWMDSGLVAKGKKLIISVVIGILLLGASGIILNLVNPNFFKTNSGGLILRTVHAF